MFPTEEEKARETAAERRRRRAGSGMDRHGLNQVAIAFFLILGGMALVVAADTAGVEKRQTNATVVGMTDRGAMHRSRECVTQLATGYGYADIYTRTACQYVLWHMGDKADVVARQLRFTRTIVVSTRGTIFEGGHSILPEW